LVSPGVASQASQREALNTFFEWVAVDDEGNPCDVVTGVTPPQGAPGHGNGTASGGPGDLPEKLDAKRIKELATWWRTQIKQRQKELSPALAKDQVKKDLREVLIEGLTPGAVDNAIKQVMQAAMSKKPTAKRKSRSKP
jgi:hypothetical protein